MGLSESIIPAKIDACPPFSNLTCMVMYHLNFKDTHCLNLSYLAETKILHFFQGYQERRRRGGTTPAKHDAQLPMFLTIYVFCSWSVAIYSKEIHSFKFKLFQFFHVYQEPFLLPKLTLNFLRIQPVFYSWSCAIF